MSCVCRGAGIAAALLLALTVLQASPAGANHSDPPDTIKLPDGWQPEGITTDGQKKLFVGSLRNGAIFQANARTGNGFRLAKGRPGRVAVGVDLDERCDRLWVAGGPTRKIRVHDADTGKTLRSYSFDAKERFLNDLVVTPRAVYATDSMSRALAVVRLPGHGCDLPRKSAGTLRLKGDFVVEEGFNLNGIVKSGRWLLAVQSNTGELFRINARTGNTVEVDLGGATLRNGDGLEPGRGVLYVVRNQNNRIAVVDLEKRLTRGAVVNSITDPDFDTPTTAALVRHSLFVVNARFNTPPTPDTEYHLTRVPARR